MNLYDLQVKLISKRNANCSTSPITGTSRAMILLLVQCFTNTLTLINTHDTHIVTMYSEEETAVRDMVKTWAQQELAPHVREMDREGAMRPDILKSLFDNGLMGMEIPEKYGGSEMNFTSAVIAVEEIAAVDPR